MANCLKCTNYPVCNCRKRKTKRRIITIRGCNFKLAHLDPQVFELAARGVFTKEGPRHYRGGCDAIERAVKVIFPVSPYLDKIAELHSNFLRVLFRPTQSEQAHYAAEFTYAMNEYGPAYFWGDRDRIKNQRARSTGLLMAAQILRSYKR